MKKCFGCKLNLPLLFYRKSTSTYQRPSDKGRLIECRLCRLKRTLKGSVIIKENNKFKVVNLTKFEAIKEFFKK